MNSPFTSFMLLGAALVVGCTKDGDASRDLPSALSASPVASGTTAPVASPSVAASGTAPALCQVVSEKVWTDGPSFAAGLTPTVFEDGRVAVGVVLGGRPQVVVFDAEGRGEVVRVALGKELRRSLGKGEKRVIARVTPGVASGGAIVAYADYREERAGTRLVACGLTDAGEPPLRFEGKPLLSGSDAEDETDSPSAATQAGTQVDPPRAESSAAAPAPPAVEPPAAAGPEGASKPSGAQSAPASAPAPTAAPKPAPAPSEAPRVAVLSRKPPALTVQGREAQLAAARDIARRRIERNKKRKTPKPPVAPPSSGPSSPAPEAVASAAPAAREEPAPAGSTGEEKLTELRSCRSFVDGGGTHSWTVGSELEGDRQKDGSVDYAMVFFVDRGQGLGRTTLLTRKLGTHPDKLATFDAPSAVELSGGRFALTARYRGVLHFWSLDAEKRPTTGVRVFGGGYPSLPSYVKGEHPTLLTALDHRGTHSLVRLTLDVDPLPVALEKLVIPGGGDSKAHPTATSLGSSRFLGYVAESRGVGAFKLLTVDDALSPLAPATDIAGADEAVVDGKIFALASGKLLAVYLRASRGKPALVSKVLSCG